MAAGREMVVHDPARELPIGERLIDYRLSMFKVQLSG